MPDLKTDRGVFRDGLAQQDLCAGIRHLAWDAGWGYDLPTMHKTGYAVLIATAVLTVLAWIIGLVVW